MDAIENSLIAISKVPANSGHSLHKGTPREAFIKEFLEAHLPQNIVIGSGEIIDSNSRPGIQRNQFDIVLYKKSFPKLDFGGGVSGFLVESVIATVEVKSTLTESDLEQSIKAAVNAKTLTPSITRSFSTGYIPPKILNYVIAYDGPAKMETVHGWIPKLYAKLGIAAPGLPVEPNERINTTSSSIDGVFVLDRGFVYFDNSPFGFMSDEARKANPKLQWVIGDTKGGNLLLFFLFLQNSAQNIEGAWLNPVPYVGSFNVPGLMGGTA